MGSREGTEKIAAKRIGVSVEVWRHMRATGHLWCWECREWLAKSIFVIDRSRGSGRAAVCRPCSVWRTLASKYGSTAAALKEMRDQQHGRCALCDRWGKRLCVDHDHKTGKIRAFLCDKCNVGLGHFNDDPEELHRAIAYLEAHNG